MTQLHPKECRKSVLLLLNLFQVVKRQRCSPFSELYPPMISSPFTWSSGADGPRVGIYLYLVDTTHFFRQLQEGAASRAIPPQNIEIDHPAVSTRIIMLHK